MIAKSAFCTEILHTSPTRKSAPSYRKNFSWEYLCASVKVLNNITNKLYIWKSMIHPPIFSAVSISGIIEQWFEIVEPDRISLRFLIISCGRCLVYLRFAIFNGCDSMLVLVADLANPLLWWRGCASTTYKEIQLMFRYKRYCDTVNIFHRRFKHQSMSHNIHVMYECCIEAIIIIS